MSFPTCFVCSRLPKNPVKSGCCGALYCWQCLISSANCVCGKPIQPEATTPAEEVLTLKCPNEATCTCVNPPFGGPLTTRVEFDKYLEKNCPFVPRMCPNAGCEVRVPLKDFLAHQNICELSLVVCPHKCSSFGMAKRLLPEHLVECPLRVVPCPYASYGCTVTPVHNAVVAHMKLYALQHAELLEAKVKVLEAKPAAHCRRGKICQQIAENPKVQQVVSDLNGELKKAEQFLQGKLTVGVLLKFIFFAFLFSLLPCFLKIPAFFFGAVKIYTKVSNPALASQSKMAFLALYVIAAFFVSSVLIRC